MPSPRVSRELAEMIDQLERQLSLLEEYATKAFSETRSEFLPEVASKLRILLVRSKQNSPLLFEVPDRVGLVPRVRIDTFPLQHLGQKRLAKLWQSQRIQQGRKLECH